jgi:hypothetical protein
MWRCAERRLLPVRLHRWRQTVDAGTLLDYAVFRDWTAENEILSRLDQVAATDSSPRNLKPVTAK